MTRKLGSSHFGFDHNCPFFILFFYLPWLQWTPATSHGHPRLLLAWRKSTDPSSVRALPFALWHRAAREEQFCLLPLPKSSCILYSSYFLKWRGTYELSFSFFFYLLFLSSFSFFQLRKVTDCFIVKSTYCHWIIFKPSSLVPEYLLCCDCLMKAWHDATGADVGASSTEQYLCHSLLVWGDPICELGCEVIGKQYCSNWNNAYITPQMD